jgi:glycosyltransferase involved in cell wall biosynthesis
MRILFLCKRQYMRKDVIDDRYGRLYHLPWELARRGHDILGVCLSYRPRPEGEYVHLSGAGGSLAWRSFNLGRSVLPGLYRYFQRVRAITAAFHPDIVIGASDSLHLVAARWIARAAGRPYAIDLYDNFESFGMTRLPGMRKLYRRAVERAGAVTCVSQPLAGHVAARCAPQGAVITLESTISVDLFHARDRSRARQQLRLPAAGRLVGTAGALDESRGIGTLYEAFRRLAKQENDIHLVLAGSPAPRLANLDHGRVCYLGQLDHPLMPELFSALDVAVVCVRDTPFGRYSFPQKAYEIIACGTPIVAAAVGAMGDLLRDCPRCLYEPDDPANLAEKIRLQLLRPQLPDIRVPSWSEQAELLEAVLEGTIAEP